MGLASLFVSSVFLRAFLVCVLLFTAIVTTEAKPDFEKCFADFNKTQNENGTYDGNTSIIYQGLTYLHYNSTPSEQRFIVSTEGCRTLCGSGNQYYHWSQIATTITTWVLPVIGTLLQAPYEANEFRKTMYALVRWIGSPIASLAYILWNIKVIGKCAILSDMSTSYSVNFAKLKLEDADGSPDLRELLDMRDALYILSVMNQYTVKSPIDPEQAEILLRQALFADIKTPTLDLRVRRQKLAMNLREGRKRGVVPLFITLMWFLFSLGISIQGAFSTLGDNATAHDLALGLLLAWFPVLILSSIVDRNPTQITASCTKLNKLLGEVDVALRIIGNGVGQNDPPVLASTFFTEFAGQGRVRWHYGIAHPIITGMETIILDRRESKSSRNWLRIPDIRNHLVRGPSKGVLLLHFDLREVWALLSAFLIVLGTISGAFTLSFRTPTIGLGCRSGGYAIFGIIAAGIFCLELLAWYFRVAPTVKELNRTGGQIAVEIRKQKEGVIATLNWIFRFFELVNTAWLIYIVMAQTIGSYQNCKCQAATWSREGGYVDVPVALKAPGHSVEPWWITGVLLSGLIMFIAIAFLVVEWCEQSHLNSVDVDKAMRGLKITQHFKYRTLWIRKFPDYCIHRSKFLWRTFSGSMWNKGHKKANGRESIGWSYA
ncbi:hypothetical protein MMC22_011884 [Lobaria immixta]|nr:hypothetical protein [Lobaria immixta]